MTPERLQNIKENFLKFRYGDDLDLEDMFDYVTLEDIKDMIYDLEKMFAASR